MNTEWKTYNKPSVINAGKTLIVHEEPSTRYFFEWYEWITVLVCVLAIVLLFVQ